MSKFDMVESIAKKLDCDYDTAFDLVYCADAIYDENETDDAL